MSKCPLVLILDVNCEYCKAGECINTNKVNANNNYCDSISPEYPF